MLQPYQYRVNLIQEPSLKSLLFLGILVREKPFLSVSRKGFRGTKAPYLLNDSKCLGGVLVLLQSSGYYSRLPT